MVKNPPANAGDAGESGLISESGRFPGGGNGNQLQYPFLENSTDRGIWQATYSPQSLKESDTTKHTCTHRV